MRDCPFCGAHMTRLRIVSKWAGSGAYRRRVGYVRCLDCNARGPLVEYRGDGSEVTFFDVRNEAPLKGCKAELAFAAEAARAWDAKPKKANPADLFARLMDAADGGQNQNIKEIEMAKFKVGDRVQYKGIEPQLSNRRGTVSDVSVIGGEVYVTVDTDNLGEWGAPENGIFHT